MVAQGSSELGTVVVTGGGQGIGRAIVDLVLERGGTPIALDRDAASIERLATQAPNALGMVCDVTDEGQIATCIAEAESRLGRIDALVNNAGIGAYFDAVEMTQEQWDLVFSVDLKAVWLVSKAVIPAMRRTGVGSIVNIASIHARMTVGGMFPYAAAKSGVIGLTRSLALDLAPEGIRVNAVSPGWTRTWLVDEYFQNQQDPKAAEDSVLSVHPMGRICEPREVAEVVCFLAGNRSSAVTGAEFCVDAGLGARFAT